MNSKSKSLSSQSTARSVIEEEAKAILALSGLIDDTFDHAVELLLDMQEHGRLVVSGIGKAGFIGMKISATFASTGLPSYFLHPAEAIHGDLGRFTKRDVLLVLSNSGETEEVLRLVPFIRRMGCSLISITGKPDSPLATRSDVALCFGNVSEAGPLGLAPTTSTSLMLAYGDALAMAVLERQNFTLEQFAFYHPGGNIGRSLMTSRELMRTGAHFCLAREGDSVRTVIHKISRTEGRPGAAAIVNEGGMLTGIFTDGNLRRCLTSEENFLDKPVKNYMGCSPKTVQAEDLVQDALRILTEFSIDQVIVVDGQGGALGMLDIQDIAALQPG